MYRRSDGLPRRSSEGVKLISWPSARPPRRTVVGLFARQRTARSWREDDAAYVPDTPPDWARVVAVGQ